MRRVLITVSIALAFALCGCTHAERASVQSGSYNSDIDWAKVNIITEDAMNKGYRVVWIHPPQKPKDEREESKR